MTHDAHDDTDQWLTSLEDGSGDAKPADDLRAIGTALTGIESAEHALLRAVGKARDNGRSWTEVANILGVSRQAARQRFGEALMATRDVQPGDTIVTSAGDTFVVSEFAAKLAQATFMKRGADVEDIERFIRELTYAPS